MIELKNITLIRSGKKLFEDFACKFDEHDNYVVSGESGSGKTLLLEILAGITHVSVGSVSYSFIKGLTWDELHAEKRRLIHYVPCHALQNLLSENTERYYQQRYYASDEVGVSVEEAVFEGNTAFLKGLNIPDNLSIEAFLPLPVTRLSNGQLKKVLLVKNLSKGIPELLILDFPFEGLDAQSRDELCHFLDFLHLSHGVQLILTDHHHHLPSVINKRVVLDHLKFIKEEAFVHESIVPATAVASTSVAGETRNPESVVELKSVTIRYGTSTIIDALNWRIQKGERWALIGRNGAGKTTLFSMIFADHPFAYSQEIYLFGKRRGTGESIWDIKKRISYLGPELTSFLNVKSTAASARDFLAGLNRGSTNVRLEELILHFDATDFINQPIRCLSSGQLQITQIIQSFLTEKEMLLLDEPFQFLDAPQKQLLKSWLRDHLSREITLLLITHYEADILDWTEKTLRL